MKRNVSPEKLTGMRSNKDWPRRELNDRRSITESRGSLGLVLTLLLIPSDGVSTCGPNRKSMRPPEWAGDDKWGFGYLIGWSVGGTSCTLQTLYAWLMRGFGIGMVGILIYRVLHLSLGCDSWYTCYVINLVK